jgi:hypothetical protein
MKRKCDENEIFKFTNDEIIVFKTIFIDNDEELKYLYENHYDLLGIQQIENKLYCIGLVKYDSPLVLEIPCETCDEIDDLTVIEYCLNIFDIDVEK